jgi:hypothetical protein
MPLVGEVVARYFFLTTFSTSTFALIGHHLIRFRRKIAYVRIFREKAVMDRAEAMRERPLRFVSGVSRHMPDSRAAIYEIAWSECPASPLSPPDVHTWDCAGP